MCPLRLILIFLSATLAGFLFLGNLKSQPELQSPDDNETQDIKDSVKTQFSNPSAGKFSKVRSTMESGFWTVVDMASGRYLWRQFVSQPSKLFD